MEILDSNWSTFRIGGLCQLYLLRKMYRPGDAIIGIMNFNQSNIVCLKYCCKLELGNNKSETSHEFTIGLRQTHFKIIIPQMADEQSGQTISCDLSFLFCIVNTNYPKTLFEDKAGVTELGPNELESKQFRCNFPISIHT